MKFKSLTMTSLVALLGLGAASSASAEVLMTFDFTDNATQPGPTSDTATYIDDGILSGGQSGTIITTGYSPTFWQPNAFGVQTSMGGSDPAHGANLAESISLDRYMSFTISPKVEMSIEEINIFFYNETESAGDNDVHLLSSVTGWDAADSLGSVTTLSGEADRYAWSDLNTVSELQNVSDPVEFRFYITGGSGGADVFSSTFTPEDAINVLGTSTVPEPATVATIMGALCLGFVVIRRQRRS